MNNTTNLNMATVGHFDFDDGGTFSGRSEGGKAHGAGVCTGPGGQGVFAGMWQQGFESSGVYTWPNGNEYGGQWAQGKRHGLGVERKGHWIYRGDWTQGLPGRYGVRQSTMSDARYEGTWTTGLQDGYGQETYTDGGTYQGQWMKGMRHGYGVRKSAQYHNSALCRLPTDPRSSLTSIRSEVEASTSSSHHHRSHHLSLDRHTTSRQLSESPTNHTTERIGFYLKAKYVEATGSERRGSFLARQMSGGSNRLNPDFSSNSSSQGYTPSQFSSDDMSFSPSFNRNDAGMVNGGSTYGEKSKAPVELGQFYDLLPVDEGSVEIYTGEWKEDKRSGFGVSERSDGVKYEGEWTNNCKHGYGVTTFPDGSREEGKYKNNVLQAGGRRILNLRATKTRERIDAAVASATRSAQIAIQKSDIANSRMESARDKAKLADEALKQARQDSDTSNRQALDIQKQEREQLLKQQQTQQSQAAPRLYRRTSNAQQLGSGPESLQPTLIASHVSALQQLPEDEELIQPVTSYRAQAAVDTKRLLPMTSMTFTSNVEEVNLVPDFSQMNHVGHGATNGGRARTSRTNSIISTTESLYYPAVQYRDDDPIEEIDDIFSYLNDEESNPDASRYSTSSTGGGSSRGSDRHRAKGLKSRQSLRQRRDVQGLDLFIFNNSGSGDERIEKDGRESESFGNSSQRYGSASNISNPSNSQYKPKRRLTLPSIMKYMGGPQGAAGKVFEENPYQRVLPHPGPLTAAARPLSASAAVVKSTPNHSGRASATSGSMTVLSNNVVEKPQVAKAPPVDFHVFQEAARRKRLELEENYQPPPPPPDLNPVDAYLAPQRELPYRYRLGSVRKLTERKDMGSVPDLTAMKEMTEEVIPRGEAHMLSVQKREELRLMREREEQIRRHAIVLRFGSLSAWCSTHQLTLLLIFVNLAAVVMFYRLVTP